MKTTTEGLIAGQYSRGTVILSRLEWKNAFGANKDHAVLTYRRSVAEHTGDFTRDSGNTGATRDSKITERFAKAVEQLGAVDKDGRKLLELHFGGIYTLQRIARDS